ncbi:TPA: hypothetical protein ACTZ5N_004513, partial [Bacillus cereus]
MLENYKDENSEIIIEKTLCSDLYFQNKKEKLGINWITGTIADLLFNQLNNFERTLISLYGHKGMTYEKAMSKMAYPL